MQGRGPADRSAASLRSSPCLPQVNPEEERLALWTTCRLSGEALCPPIVADELGSLFNKEALLQALLAKKLPRGLRHIQGLKSVIPLKLEVVKPDGKPAGGAAGAGWQTGVLQGLHGCPRRLLRRAR